LQPTIANEIFVWRSAAVPAEVASGYEGKVGKLIRWRAMTSASLSQKAALKSFAGNLVFKIETRGRPFIAAVSAFEGEWEVLFGPTIFRVDRATRGADGVTTVDLTDPLCISEFAAGYDLARGTSPGLDGAL
jgi:hypothetical protein